MSSVVRVLEVEKQMPIITLWVQSERKDLSHFISIHPSGLLELEQGTVVISKIECHREEWQDEYGCAFILCG